MAERVFLSIEMVLDLHHRSLVEHGGSSGIRDQGGLESAVAQAKNDFYYGNADAFGIAAAYAFHIAQAQAFLDGNKRTAIGSALLSLQLAGVPVTTAHTEELQNAMTAIANHELDKAGLGALFRRLFA
jgi:death-on-curing protein